MSLWTSRGQLQIIEDKWDKSCGQGGEWLLSEVVLNVTDLHKYKYLVVGKKFFCLYFIQNPARNFNLNRI
jgi:hypothetical protein